MNIFKFLMDEYGYSEPILTEELKELLPIQGSTLCMKLKRLVDDGKLERYSNGVYFIPTPTPNPSLKEDALSIDKIIRKKYLLDRDKLVGYKTGKAFANQ